MSFRKTAMKPKHQRLVFWLLSLVFMVAAVLLTLQAFKENIVFFYSPTDLKTAHVQGKTLRVGGLVKAGSLEQDGQHYSFLVTDGNEDVRVTYDGMMPNLFREGQGVVAEGMMDDAGTFKARTILAKHDENYMPREVVESLKKQGVWKGELPTP